jgi:hypothetical protein
LRHAACAEPAAPHQLYSEGPHLLAFMQTLAAEPMQRLLSPIPLATRLEEVSPWHDLEMSDDDLRCPRSRP